MKSTSGCLIRMIIFWRLGWEIRLRLNRGGRIYSIRIKRFCVKTTSKGWRLSKKTWLIRRGGSRRRIGWIRSGISRLPIFTIKSRWPRRKRLVITRRSCTLQSRGATKILWCQSKSQKSWGRESKNLNRGSQNLCIRFSKPRSTPTFWWTTWAKSLLA